MAFGSPHGLDRRPSLPMTPQATVTPELGDRPVPLLSATGDLYAVNGSRWQGRRAATLQGIGQEAKYPGGGYERASSLG